MDLGEWVELTMATVVPPLLQWAGVDEEGEVVISSCVIILVAMYR